MLGFGSDKISLRISSGGVLQTFKVDVNKKSMKAYEKEVKGGLPYFSLTQSRFLDPKLCPKGSNKDITAWVHPQVEFTGFCMQQLDNGNINICQFNYFMNLALKSYGAAEANYTDSPEKIYINQQMGSLKRSRQDHKHFYPHEYFCPDYNPVSAHHHSLPTTNIQPAPPNPSALPIQTPKPVGITDQVIAKFVSSRPDAKVSKDKYTGDTTVSYYNRYGMPEDFTFSAGDFIA